MKNAYDVIILGTGPGGSATATYLAERGLSVLAIEKDAFPRFHIGESLTGSVGEVIRELGLGETMGTHEYPEKPGVTVIGRDARNEFFVPVLNPTWQVRRSTFDHLLRQRSARAGTEFLRGRARRIEREGDRVTGVYVVPQGGDPEILVRCGVFIDASGQTAFLSRHGVAGAKQIDAFSDQIAFFTHFEGVPRDPGPLGNNTTIFYSEHNHWAWMIPISPTVDSFGVVIPKQTYKSVASTPEEALRWGIANINPEIIRRLADVKQVEELRACADYSYRIDPFVGSNWACVGDSHRFLDPIFSFGVSFAMMEGRFVSEAITEHVGKASLRDALIDYARWSDTGQNVAFDLINYFWRFPVFFGYHMQNPALRTEVIQLFGGACFRPQGMRVPELFREALGDESAQATDLDPLASGKAEAKEHGLQLG